MTKYGCSFDLLIKLPSSTPPGSVMNFIQRGCRVSNHATSDCCPVESSGRAWNHASPSSEVSGRRFFISIIPGLGWLRCWADGAAFHEFCFGEALAAVYFSCRDLRRPAPDLSEDLPGFPCEVGDAGVCPGEGRVVVDADQRDMLWSKDTAAGEVLLDSGEEKGLVDDQRGRRGYAEEGIEATTQAVRSILPVGQVICTCGNSVCFQLSQETGAESSQWSGALGFAH